MRTTACSILLLCAVSQCVFAQSPDKARADSLKKLANNDREASMRQLHIKSIRRAPDSISKKNVDKDGLYGPIPDALTLTNGKKVTTAAMWWKQRRPELVEYFDSEIYGRVPANTPKVTWKVTNSEQTTHGGVPVIVKTLVGHVDNASYPSINVDIQMILTVPANAKKPVPVMMELTFPEDYKQLDQTPGAEPSWQLQVLNKGWAYCMFLPPSLQADNAAGLTQGIIGLMNKGQYRKPDDWGGCRAWAWGASRALDYFETDKMLDAKHVGLEGHSRYGKTALVAAAYDSRFAVVYSSSSGEGGAKLHRHNLGEQVENLASGPYYWFAGNFLKYAGPLHSTDLPVDSHELIDLIAPRPVFIGGGANGDDWADPKGMFMAEVAAGPVYKLLGKKDLGITKYPGVDEAVIGGDLGFRLHHGGHTPALNWATFIEFASKYWK